MDFTSPLVSTDNVAIVPIGWKRLRDGNKIYYLSPTKDKLWSLSDIVKYVSTDGTCKCNLQCPLFVDKVFTFSLDVKQMEAPFDKGRSKFCNCPIIRRGRPRKYKLIEGMKINYKKKQYFSLKTEELVPLEDVLSLDELGSIGNTASNSKETNDRVKSKKLSNSDATDKMESFEDGNGKPYQSPKNKSSNGFDKLTSKTRTRSADYKQDGKKSVKKAGTKREVETANVNAKKPKVAKIVKVNNRNQVNLKNKNKQGGVKVTKDGDNDQNKCDSDWSISKNKVTKVKKYKKKKGGRNKNEGNQINTDDDAAIASYSSSPTNIDNRQPSPSFDYNEHLIMPTTGAKVSEQSNSVAPRMVSRPNYYNPYHSTAVSSGYDVGHSSLHVGVQSHSSNLIPNQMNDLPYAQTVNHGLQMGSNVDAYRKPPVACTPMESQNSYNVMSTPTITNQQPAMTHGTATMLPSGGVVQSNVGSVNNMEQHQHNFMMLDQHNQPKRLIAPSNLGYVNVNMNDMDKKSPIYMNNVNTAESLPVNSVGLSSQPSTGVYSTGTTAGQNSYLSSNQQRDLSCSVDSTSSSEIAGLPTQLRTEDCRYYGLAPPGSSYSYSGPTSSRKAAATNVMPSTIAGTNAGGMSSSIGSTHDSSGTPNPQTSQMIHQFVPNLPLNASSNMIMQNHPQLLHQRPTGQNTQPPLSDFRHNSNNRINMQKAHNTFMNNPGSNSAQPQGNEYVQSNFQMNPPAQRMIYSDMASGAQVMHQPERSMNYPTSATLSNVVNVTSQSDRVANMPAMSMADSVGVTMHKNDICVPNVQQANVMPNVQQTNVMLERQQSQLTSDNCQSPGYTATLLEGQEAQIVEPSSTVEQ